MVVIPAIDLKGGKCVRLWQGRSDMETVFSDDPASVARRWQSEGASMIHVVDLDGALEGSPRNLGVLGKIVESVDVPIQFGGGLREIESIRSVFELGVKRAVVGTKAALDEGFLRSVAEEFRDSVIVSVDVRDGFVAVEGWTKSSGLSLEEFAKKLRDFGFSRAIVTDVRRDGTLTGPNPGLLEAAARAGLGVIAAGGITTLDDVKTVSSIRGVEGCIIGKALYLGTLGLAEAIRAASSEAPRP